MSNLPEKLGVAWNLGGEIRIICKELDRKRKFLQTGIDKALTRFGLSQQKTWENSEKNSAGSFQI